MRMRTGRALGGFAWLAVVVVTALILIGGSAAIVCKAAVDCRAVVGLKDDDTDPPPVVVRGGGVFPPGFVERPVARGLLEPTDFTFLPDGRILVAERRGLIRMVARGKLASRPVLDLRHEVSTAGLLGIITIQVDPDFPRMPYVYVLRALRPTGPDAAPTSARLSRFTLEGSIARRDSEVVLLGRDGGGSSCLELPASADCLPADSEHIGSQIRFDGDALYVSTGDGGGAGGSGGFDAISGRAQDLDALGGKILRITRTGAGLPSNPYWNGDPGANRSKVWASGVRNPFRTAFRPGTHDLYVADLGNRAFDEISIAARGANLGWPCYEGTARFGPYAETDMCLSLYEKGGSAVQPPAVEFRQDAARTLVGGVFYTGRTYPKRYAGAYVFADFTYGWMKLLRFGADRRPVGRAQPFGSGLSGPVAIQQGPDGGDLFYLSYVKGALNRVAYRRG